jgi:hypothetical protein
VLLFFHSEGEQKRKPFFIHFLILKSVKNPIQAIILIDSISFIYNK